VSLAERDVHSRARRFPPPAPPEAAARTGGDPRATALIVLAASAAIGLLWWAQAVFVPILLSVLISHALEPFVAFLERRRIPRALGVFVVLTSVIAGLGYGAYALGEPASTFIDQMPSQAQKLRRAFERRTRDGSNPIDRVQEAANELERAAGAAAKTAPPPAGVQRVRIEEPPFHLGDLVWRGSRGLVEFFAAVAVVFFLTCYLLLEGNSYRRKIAGMAGTALSRKRRVLRILRDIDDQIRRYLLARAFISIIVALATGSALAALGMKQAVMWGVVAGVLNVIPYVGPLAAIAAITIAGFAQFGNLAQTALVFGASSLIAFLEGYVITPKLTGHAGSMNAVSIFTGILFWGWLWGVWGMLLAVPLMTAIKAICARVEGLNPIAQLLSE
jgi:predicted PurR-regulated permease PerM